MKLKIYKKMIEEKEIPAEKTDAFWRLVYAAVIFMTVAVIAALAFFSYYFSR